MSYSHNILFHDPFLSQFPPPEEQGKQSDLLHPFALSGSALAIDLPELPALSIPGIRQRVFVFFIFSFFLQASFLSLGVETLTRTSHTGFL